MQRNNISNLLYQFNQINVIIINPILKIYLLLCFDFFLIHFIQGNINFFSFQFILCHVRFFFCYSGHFLNIFFSHIFILISLNIHSKQKNMLVDYKYILFNIKNDKLSIFCILTHRYGKHRKSQSMKD